MSTFHVRNEFFFTRLPGGAVRIRKFSQPLLCGKPWPLDEDTGDVLDITVSGMEWVSVIASMSGQEIHAAYEMAKDFHLQAGGGV